MLDWTKANLVEAWLITKIVHSNYSISILLTMTKTIKPNNRFRNRHHRSVTTRRINDINLIRNFSAESSSELLTLPTIMSRDRQNRESHNILLHVSGLRESCEWAGIMQGMRALDPQYILASEIQQETWMLKQRERVHVILFPGTFLTSAWMAKDPMP